MNPSPTLEIDYRSHEPVQEVIDIVQGCIEDLSIEFEKYEEENVIGPGLYFAIVSGHTVRDYADPMGENRWPVELTRDVRSSGSKFREAASTVGHKRDGAVVVSVDGIIQQQLVRFFGHSARPSGTIDPGTIEYADWMGSRHMSAVDTSLRPEVVVTLTLSAETGRVTVFHDGEFSTRTREALLSDAA